MAAMQITFDEERATGIPSHHAIQSRQIEDKKVLGNNYISSRGSRMRMTNTGRFSRSM
jgi:hypothetical protein